MLGVVCVSIFLVVIDASIVNVAFPTIGADLNTTDAVLSWILTVYNVTVASLLLLAGRAADRLGRKRVFLVSVAVFTLGSLLCSLAPSAGALIAFRVVQAAGGSAIFPASLSLVLPEFPVQRRSMAVGVWAAVAGLGGAVGPSAGALLIELFGWRGIFWPNVPIGVVVVVLGRRVLAESRSPADTGRLDVIGVPVSVLGVALVLLAVVQAEHWGYTSARTLTLIVVGLALLPVLVWRSRRHPSPVLDLALFRIRSFRVATVATLFFGCGFLGGFFINSLLLQRLWDWPIWKTGSRAQPGPADVGCQFLAVRPRRGPRGPPVAHGRGVRAVRRLLRMAVLACRRRTRLRVGLPPVDAHAGRRRRAGDHLHDRRAPG